MGDFIDDEFFAQKVGKLPKHLQLKFFNAARALYDSHTHQSINAISSTRKDVFDTAVEIVDDFETLREEQAAARARAIAKAEARSSRRSRKSRSRSKSSERTEPEKPVVSPAVETVPEDENAPAEEDVKEETPPPTVDVHVDDGETEPPKSPTPEPPKSPTPEPPKSPTPEPPKSPTPEPRTPTPDGAVSKPSAPVKRPRPMVKRWSNVKERVDHMNQDWDRPKQTSPKKPKHFRHDWSNVKSRVDHRTFGVEYKPPPPPKAKKPASVFKPKPKLPPKKLKPIKSVKGKPINNLVILGEITENQNTEVVLENSDSIYRELTDIDIDNNGSHDINIDNQLAEKSSLSPSAAEDHENEKTNNNDENVIHEESAQDVKDDIAAVEDFTQTAGNTNNDFNDNQLHAQDASDVECDTKVDDVKDVGKDGTDAGNMNDDTITQSQDTSEHNSDINNKAECKDDENKDNELSSAPEHNFIGDETQSNEANVSQTLPENEIKDGDADLADEKLKTSETSNENEISGTENEISFNEVNEIDQNQENNENTNTIQGNAQANENQSEPLPEDATEASRDTENETENNIAAVIVGTQANENQAETVPEDAAEASRGRENETENSDVDIVAGTQANENQTEPVSEDTAEVSTDTKNQTSDSGPVPSDEIEHNGDDTVVDPSSETNENQSEREPNAPVEVETVMHIPDSGQTSIMSSEQDNIVNSSLTPESGIGVETESTSALVATPKNGIRFPSIKRCRSASKTRTSSPVKMKKRPVTSRGHVTFLPLIHKKTALVQDGPLIEQEQLERYEKLKDKICQQSNADSINAGTENKKITRKRQSPDKLVLPPIEPLSKPSKLLVHKSSLSSFKKGRVKLKESRIPLVKVNHNHKGFPNMGIAQSYTVIKAAKALKSKGSKDMILPPLKMAVNTVGFFDSAIIVQNVTAARFKYLQGQKSPRNLET